MRESLRTVFRNAGALLSGDIAANLLRLGSVAILTRSLGVDLFGTYVLVLAYVEIVNRLLNVQTWEAIVKFGSEAIASDDAPSVARTVKAAASIDAVSMVAAAAIAWSFAPWFLRYFGIGSELLSATRLLCLTILAYLAETSIGVFRIYGRFGLQARINAATAAIQVVLFGAASALRPTFEGFALATLAAAIVGVVLKSVATLLVLRREVGLRRLVGARIELRGLRESGLLRFVFYRNIDVSIRMVSRQLDVLVLGGVFPVGVVGIYRVAVQVAGVLGKLADPVYQSIYPEVARLLAAARRDEAKRLARRIGSLLATGCAAFYAVYLVVGRSVVTLAFGDGFAESYLVGLVYLAALAIAFVSSPLFALQLGFGQTRNMMTNQLLATALYVPLLLVLARHMGPYGAALAYVAYYVTIVGLTAKNVRHCLGQAV